MLLFGCSSGGPAGDSTDSNQTGILEVQTGNNALLIDQPELDWSNCVDQPALECASLLVPLDYSNPEGETISVAMARRQALAPSSSTRTLILNPGGPGGPGLDFLDTIVRFGDISDELRDTFNFVSFDPRGIGESESVVCDTTDLFTLHPYPDTRLDIASNFNFFSRFAQSCFESHGDYTPHLGSLNVVRDIDEMRKALGLTEIDFLGFSYGTRLAALYMQTYPQSTGRFVLDGSMTPNPRIAPLVAGGLLPGQANIDSLAAACIGVTIVCSPSEFATDLQSRIDELSVGPVTDEAALVYRLLQFAATNPGFEQLMIDGFSRYLETQNIVQLVVLIDILGLGESDEDNGGFSITAFIAVMCADDPTRPSIDSLDALRIEFNAVSDLIAETLMFNAGMCSGWPVSLEPIPQIATNQAPASLVIGGTTDAQTPLVFAQEMAAAVGGQFLRSEHDGHTVSFVPGHSCVNTAVETFLLTGTLPSTSVCLPDSAVSPIAARNAIASDNPNAADWRDKVPSLFY